MSQVTKRALEASLKKLLLERPLDKITVTDIAEDCGINRMTFYYHFRDIYDLPARRTPGGYWTASAPIPPGRRGSAGFWTG